MNTEKSLGEGKMLEVVSTVRRTLMKASKALVNLAFLEDSGNNMPSFIYTLGELDMRSKPQLL